MLPFINFERFLIFISFSSRKIFKLDPWLLFNDLLRDGLFWFLYVISKYFLKT